MYVCMYDSILPICALIGPLIQGVSQGALVGALTSLKDCGHLF